MSRVEFKVRIRKQEVNIKLVPSKLKYNIIFNLRIV